MYIIIFKLCDLQVLRHKYLKTAQYIRLQDQ